MRFYLSLLFLLLVLNSSAQQLSISGNVQDTIAKKPLRYAVVMVVKVSDSSLSAFTRTDANGAFQLNDLPLDTFRVLISHQRFAEQSFYVFASPDNHVFNFGKIILPNQAVTTKEVVIYAYKDPIYYKGDTLTYSADSFKVKPNAVVEDLLKKLPGIKVDATGGISAQGKKIDQVLVDGDEFFGADPTMATKNLNASALESVQIYEKKNENATAENSSETVQVMNLKLKDEAKKGYFGKVSAASNFTTFHEGDFLLNKFDKNQKISVFGLASNTPRSSFGFSDLFKYGLLDELNSATEDDDEDRRYYFSTNDQQRGIPKSIKTGLYYADKLGKNTKITANYSYRRLLLRTRTQQHRQYYLADSSYSTDNTIDDEKVSQNHTTNITVKHTLDSLTELELTSKSTYSPTEQNTNDNTLFLDQSENAVRGSFIKNTLSAIDFNSTSTLALKKRFLKKGRFLRVSYSYGYIGNTADGFLNADNYSLFNSANNSLVNQQKSQEHASQSHQVKTAYTEPLSKKFNVEWAYEFNYLKGEQNKKTTDKVGATYSQENALFSNHFINTKEIQKLSTKLIYEVKKQKLSMGTAYRLQNTSSLNLKTAASLDQHLNTLLPFLFYDYKFSDNKRFNFTYSTASIQPTLNQLQPVNDNTNPNYTVIGNPNLLPNYTHNLRINYNSYKPISGFYVYTALNASISNDDFSNSIVFDSIGRSVSQSINVNGNQNYDGEFSVGIPVFSQFLNIEPDITLWYSKNASFINGQRNNTSNKSIELALDLENDEDAYFNIGSSYTYTVPTATINPENYQPYLDQDYHAELTIPFYKKYSMDSKAAYHVLSRRSQGYNLNYLLWDLSISRKLLKTENLILSIDAVDLLNQNTNAQRFVTNNVITDTRSNVIGRYVLAKLVYKFNSQKKKDDGQFTF